ncbi:MAG TPA: thioredoxin family protein [Mollicutes bacterium]|nr:thioredoxin family protein [Mollicutes bacterium]
MKKNLTSILIGIAIVVLMLIPVFIDKGVGYIEPTKASEYLSVVDSDKTIMAVIGRDSCPACSQYKPIYNDVGLEYDLDIYYINTDLMPEAELSEILHSDLVIPAKCHSSEEEVPLYELEAVPLTIFTKDGEIIDCISGVAQKDYLIDTFKTLEMID